MTGARLRRMFDTCILCLPLLAACEKSAVPVSIHGVNYSLEPFSFELQDPHDPKNKGVGELVDSYSAGGTTCCFLLPMKWQPGIQVSIRAKHWIGKTADKSLHDVGSIHLVEVPRYPDGKPGELWVLRRADGTMDIVSSDFQPNDPQWPGQVRGWPVPSLAYQRERWDVYIDIQADYVRTFEELLRKLALSPDETAQDDWDTSLKYDSKALLGFSGPGDVGFRKRLKQQYETGLARSRTEFDRLQKERP